MISRERCAGMAGVQISEGRIMNIREKLFVFIVGVALSAAVFAGPTDGTVDLGQGGGGTHFH